MTNVTLPIDKINDAIKTHLPEEISTDGFHIFMWRTTLQCRIVMLKKKGYSDEFIDKFVDRNIELFVAQLLNEREA